MQAKWVYLALCVPGTILPYWHFVPFVREHGLNAEVFVDQLFSTPVGGFFGMDVIVSSLALWMFVFTQGARDRVSHRWLPVVANILVGVSLGLPLFLYMRERRLAGPANAQSRNLAAAQPGVAGGNRG